MARPHHHEQSWRIANRQKARTLYLLEQRRRCLNPYSHGTLVPDENTKYSAELHRIDKRIRTIRQELIATAHIDGKYTGGRT